MSENTVTFYVFLNTRNDTQRMRTHSSIFFTTHVHTLLACLWIRRWSLQRNGKPVSVDFGLCVLAECASFRHDAGDAGEGR